MYTLYVDGGGTATVPTYFSYLCPETKERYWAGKTYVEFNPVSMNRFYLSKLAPELLPYGCSVVNGNGQSSNNIGEYAALYYSLERFISVIGCQPVTIFQDSELIVNQVNTRVDLFNVFKPYECKAEHLIPWLNAIERLWYVGINLKWIPREEIVKVLGH
jgi:hypothetical protein